MIPSTRVSRFMDKSAAKFLKWTNMRNCSRMIVEFGNNWLRCMRISLTFTKKASSFSNKDVRSSLSLMYVCIPLNSEWHFRSLEAERIQILKGFGQYTSKASSVQTSSRKWGQTGWDRTQPKIPRSSRTPILRVGRRSEEKTALHDYGKDSSCKRWHYPVENCQPLEEYSNLWKVVAGSCAHEILDTRTGGNGNSVAEWNTGFRRVAPFNPPGGPCW